MFGLTAIQFWSFFEQILRGIIFWSFQTNLMWNSILVFSWQIWCGNMLLEYFITRSSSKTIHHHNSAPSTKAFPFVFPFLAPSSFSYRFTSTVFIRGIVKSRGWTVAVRLGFPCLHRIAKSTGLFPFGINFNVPLVLKFLWFSTFLGTVADLVVRLFQCQFGTPS